MLSLPCGVTASTLDTLPSYEEIERYFTIATDNNDDDAAIQSSNGEHGANRDQLSDDVNRTDPGSGGSDSPDLDDVFFQNGDRWETQFAPTGQALDVRESVEYRGDMALTSTRGRFDFSDTDLYAQDGISCADTNLGRCEEGASNATYYDPLDTPPNADGSGGTGSALGAGEGVINFDPTSLIAELDAWHAFTQSLVAEVIITADKFENENRKDGSGPRYTNIDASDANNDGIVVFDIDPNGGDKFEINNTDWIIDSAEGKLAIFRLVGDTILDMSNSSILVGSGYDSFDFFLNQMDRSPFGAVFVAASPNEDVQVFNTDNTVLNGVAFHELSAFAGGGYNENSNNRITLSNSQGCAQFIAPEVQFSNTRFNGCTTPVPVPASVAMMATGLGSIAIFGSGGAVLRRFRRA